MQYNKTLDKLVENQTIKDYTLENVNDIGEVGKISQFRNTERLTIIFNNDKKLVIDEVCSGSAENTTLVIW